MAMEQIKQFHCKLCDYIQTLRGDESISVCPACNNGENKVYIFSKKDIDSIKSREDVINWVMEETK